MYQDRSTGSSYAGAYNKRKVGQEYEALAEKYLQQHGCKILERNYRNRSGEIDLIVLDGETIVFVEVKFRKTLHAGTPLEAVNFRKQKQICKVSDYYRLTHGISEFCALRFDVISVLDDEVTWLKNAFEYLG